MFKKVEFRVGKFLKTDPEIICFFRFDPAYKKIKKFQKYFSSLINSFSTAFSTENRPDC